MTRGLVDPEASLVLLHSPVRLVVLTSISFPCTSARTQDVVESWKHDLFLWKDPVFKYEYLWLFIYPWFMFMVSHGLMSILLNNNSYVNGDKSVKSRDHIGWKSWSYWICLVRCRLGSSMAGAANAYVQQRVLQVKNLTFKIENTSQTFYFQKLLSFFGNVIQFFRLNLAFVQQNL